MQDEVESKTLTLIQEDSVMAMEVLELTDAQTQVFLDSPSPLADVYRHFEKLETGYQEPPERRPAAPKKREPER